MNHCRKCDSDYATPGTCNCFAAKSTQTQTIESADYWRGYAAGQASRGYWNAQPYWYRYSPTVGGGTCTYTTPPPGDATWWTVQASPSAPTTSGFMQVVDTQSFTR